jgi:hypothetical protein
VWRRLALPAAGRRHPGFAGTERGDTCWLRGRASARLSADSSPAEVAQDEEHDQDNDHDRDDASHWVPPLGGSPRAHA